MNMNASFLLYLIILFAHYLQEAVCEDNENQEKTPPPILRAVVESCPGCSLNRLPEVKRFIYDDVPLYLGVDFKKIPGAPPELVFLDEHDQEVERIPLSNKSRQECNDLLKMKGFRYRSNFAKEL